MWLFLKFLEGYVKLNCQIIYLHLVLLKTVIISKKKIKYKICIKNFNLEKSLIDVDFE